MRRKQESHGSGPDISAWTWLLALLLAVCLAQACAIRAHAEAGGTSAVTVVPADGRSRGIELHTQTVDVVISQDDAAVWADTQVWIKLYNPATRTITVPLALPGPQLTPGNQPGNLPADLLIRLDDTPLAMTPIPPAGEQGPSGLTAQIIMRGQGAVSLRLSYRQALPESGGLVTFAYPLSAADQWANTPESLRISVRFGDPIVAEQILVQAPPAHTFDGQSLTWRWEGVRALEDVGVTFLAPAWWAEFSAARAAAAGPAATAAAHLALSRHYQHLAALAPPPIGDSTRDPIDFYARYYPAAVAELQVAAAKDANTPIADRITAHASLANLYRDQANRLGLNGKAYLELAVDEANAALALGATDPALRSLAADAYVRLAQISQAQGDAAAAERYAAALAALQGGTTPAEQARGLTLIAAAQASARGDLANARQLLSKAAGPEAATLPDAPPPAARQALVSVATTPRTRTITLTLADIRDAADVRALIQRAADRLRAASPVTVTVAASGLTVTLPWQDAQELITVQTALATALPDDPELALLAAALSPTHITWRTADDLLRHSLSYVEYVDLEPARLIWLALANRLEKASRASVGAPGSDDRLPEIQRALWAADAGDWRALATRSRVEYRIDMGGPAAARAWQLTAGSARALAVAATDWSGPKAYGVAGAAGLLLILLALAVWKAS